jgi:hypothetical protein
VLVVLLMAAAALINYSPVQTWLARKAAKVLSDRLETKVSVANLKVGFLNSLLVQGVYIEDKKKDTILYAWEINVRITDWFIFKEKPVLHYVGLKDAYVHLYRDATSKDWNYDFLADAFSTPQTTDNAQSKPFEFDLEKVKLENVRFHMDDRWIGEDMYYDIGNASINSKGLNFKNKTIDVKSIEISKSQVALNEYKGGRPRHLRPKYLDTFDVTPFNKGMWKVNVKDVTLRECGFRLKSDDRIPEEGHFDESHLDIQDINISISDAHIVGDTIRGNIDMLRAADRSGLAIKRMKCRATVSPIASICEDLYMETNNSIIRDYYAMHYRHFPDFNHYLDSVTMVANLRNSILDKRDLEYFADEMKVFPEMRVSISGKGRGTVTSLSAKDLSLSDGNIALKGDLTMDGLPDIYTTYITFTDGQILTTGNGILHYAPSYRGSPNVAIDSLTRLYFTGSYMGYIEDFKVSGIAASNMGTISTDMAMKIPRFNSDSASYAGTIASEQLQLGRLIKQPMLGNITLNETVSGYSFNPENLRLRLDGTMSQLGVNGYNYTNLTTHGVLAKKQFTGELIADDPNFALRFNGMVDYAGAQLKINAKAHVDKIDFRALLLTEDQFTVASDFDLDWTGSAIDEFTGYAKLSNLDVARNGRRLNLEHVYVTSTGDSANRNITVNSDAFNATVTGDYRLTQLPVSVQYYLAKYIPNYIKPPLTFPRDQDINFKVTTFSVDSILAVAVPLLRGFDNATVSGRLNTSDKTLHLNTTIPYGRIGNVHFRNVSILGEGDLEVIGINTTIGDVALGDSILNGSMSLTATLGNDSVTFELATVSPDKEGSITLNGGIVAYSDTLKLNMAPSQFFMRKVKWDIEGGSSVIYSDNYLAVKGVKITSGAQKLSVSTSPQGRLRADMSNIDVAWLGNIANVSSLAPDGRVSGYATVENIFTGPVFRAEVGVKDFKLGDEMIGDVVLAGTYDAARQLLMVAPQTGIHRDDATVSAVGSLSFDRKSGAAMDGSVIFKNARVSWASPFLTGLFSNVAGNVNGTVNVTGTTDKPVIGGSVELTDGALKMDYMGCSYTIPKAVIGISNNRIDFGRTQLLDEYKNTALLTGYFSHDLFDNMRMRIGISTRKFEVMNLGSKDNELFYGKMIAAMDSITVRGPFNDVRINLHNGRPAAKSTLYIPATSGGYTGGYSYVTFKTYGTDQDKKSSKRKDRITINLDANMNELAEVHIVMDASTGDEIIATGNGNVQVDLPPNRDMSIAGLYTITQGTYSITFRQVLIHRMFRLTPGSTISFNGPFAQTSLAVDAVYSVRARLYDLLTASEKASLASDPNQAIDAQTPQNVNVILHMRGPVYTPQLTFDLDLENKHGQASIAYRKLTLINRDDRQKFDQVASLLLVGTFIPPEGLGQSAVSGAITNNVSQMLSSTASQTLTNIVNKLIGDRNLNVSLKYTNYNYGDQSATGAVNRNQLKLGVSKNYLNDRLMVSVGSTSDWGRPTTTNAASNFNFAGDFRVQYQVKENSNVRLNVFHTSDYDVTLNRNVQRSGVGLGWRKSFDNVWEFFRGNKYALRQKQLQLDRMEKALDSAALKKNQD